MGSNATNVQTVELTVKPPKVSSSLQKAINDVHLGLNRWELWGTLGWHDIRQRYRRSVIGPFWISLSMGIMVGGLSLLWSTLFRQQITTYLPYFATGYIIWTFLSSITTEGSTVFHASEGIIKQIPTPLSVHVFRVVWRNIIVAVHNLSIYVVIAIILKVYPSWGILIGIVGFALLSVLGFFTVLIVGILSARFRDIPPLITSMLQMAFFFSPILWTPESLPVDKRYLALFNPFYHLLQIVRAPLLGESSGPTSWAVVIVITTAMAALAFSLFSRFRSRIAFWV